MAKSQAYGEAGYWDKRYAVDAGAFDWYQKYPSLAPLLHLYIPPLLRQQQRRILVVGCGNADLSEDMMKDGYSNVVSIDISSVVIHSMRNKYPAHQYIQMDVRDMKEFQSASFDAVIDKGTLDSLLCGSNSQENASAMLEEVGRVLKHGGVYILITYGAPAYRLSLLKDSLLWRIKLHVIEKSGEERRSEGKKWELMEAVPLNDDGSSVESVLGSNPQIHYIYICTKDDSLRVGLNKNDSSS